jgi:hypothetical protein
VPSPEQPTHTIAPHHCVSYDGSEQVQKAHPTAVLTDEVIQSLINMVTFILLIYIIMRSPFISSFIVQNMVDNVPLLLNTKVNDFIAVSLYVDDQGILDCIDPSIEKLMG